MPDPEFAGGLQLCKGIDHALESWFICSLSTSELLEKWAAHYIKYNLEVQRDASQYLAKKYSIPGLMFRIQSSLPRAKRWWFGWFLRKVYRRQPYFVISYSFEFVLNELKEKQNLYKLYLPIDLHAWSYFNSNQTPDLKLDELNPVLLSHLELQPFIKLDWKRSPAVPLSELDRNNVFRYFWETSQTKLNGIQNKA